MNAWNSSWTGICCRDEHGFPNSERSEKRYRSGQRNFEGNLLFGPVTTSPPGEAKGIGLAPVAVRPDVQSQGIGSQLIREGLRLCQELAKITVWYLEPRNIISVMGSREQAILACRTNIG